MRQLVLEGMAEEDIRQLTEEVKSANLTLEQAYMWDGLFERLADKDSLYWNYFYEEGEIQIGWAYDGSDEDIAEIQEKEGLSVEEIYEKYGAKVKAYNDCDAESSIALLSGLKETVQTEELRNELQRVMDEIQLAAETREVEHVQNAYMLLHDMDYFLLRYGPEDVGPYVTDKSTISQYYGALPATQRLRAEMDELAARKAALQSEYKKAQREEQEYDTLRQNVEALLEKPREQGRQRQQSNDLE